MNFVYSFLLLFFICLNTYTTSSEIKIKYLVDDEIITNFDIEDEKNYLLFINPNLLLLFTESLAINLFSSI